LAVDNEKMSVKVGIVKTGIRQAAGQGSANSTAKLSFDDFKLFTFCMAANISQKIQ
jgi:hypothetical protein